MLVQCPQCQAQYNLNDSIMAGKKKKRMKCAKCQHIWSFNADGSVYQPEQEKPPEVQPQEKQDPENVVQETQTQEPEKKETQASQEASAESTAEAAVSSKVGIAMKPPLPGKGSLSAVQKIQWGALAACIVLLFGSLFIFKNQIARIWPATAILYNTIHVPIEVVGQGLEFRNVEADRSHDEHGVVLVIQGQIVNISQENIKLPATIRAISMTSDRKPIEKWNINLPEKMLSPGESQPFESVLRNVNGYASDVMVRFSDVKD